jgi:hypothetical protein
MNIEDEQKAMLADDLSAYIKDKHSKEECIGFIDGYISALTNLMNLFGLPGVSQQRELLDEFCRTMEFDVKHETYEEDINYFLNNKQ